MIIGFGQMQMWRDEPKHIFAKFSHSFKTSAKNSLISKYFIHGDYYELLN